MTLTLQEARVLAFCKRRPVVTLERVCSVLCLAPITVYRALKKHAYFSSINYNARYYTLATTPLFAEDGLERTWRENKRRCRGRHGRAQVKKDMQALPAEAMLVGNLAIPAYVEAVVESWAELPQRLAEVASRESF